MTEILVKVPSKDLLNEVLNFLKKKGIDDPILLQEEQEDQILANLMNESDRSKTIALDKSMSLR
ncbi:MAG: hypothetical protein V3V00_05745 [Saprospiraceae bacterium]